MGEVLQPLITLNNGRIGPQPYLVRVRVRVRGYFPVTSLITLVLPEVFGYAQIDVLAFILLKDLTGAVEALKQG